MAADRSTRNETQDSRNDQNSGACCAHLRVSYRTEPCDGYSIRGEVMPGSGTRGWWECDLCGTYFMPRLAETEAEILATDARIAAEAASNE